MALTQTRLKELLDYDPETGVFMREACHQRPDLLGKPAGRPNTSGHIQISIDGKRYLAHRLAWFWMHGVWPQEIDHRNRDKKDNRINNLRDGTRAENQHNTGLRKNNSSGFVGVCFRPASNKWYADIQANKRSYFLGAFDSPELASAAYQAAKTIYHPTAPAQ